MGELPKPSEYVIEVRHKGSVVATFSFSPEGEANLLRREEVEKISENLRWLVTLVDSERDVYVDVSKVKDNTDEYIDWLLDEIHRLREELGYEDDDP
ncbi:MAG: hypothetical protein QXT64_04820 [Desulfurococcaceae archaeon]